MKHHQKLKLIMSFERFLACQTVIENPAGLGVGANLQIPILHRYVGVICRSGPNRAHAIVNLNTNINEGNHYCESANDLRDASQI